MTVCIAAVCNVGPNQPAFVVAASDRMITIGGLEYEPNQRKVAEFGTSTIAMFAGDMQLHAAVTPKTLERIRELVADRDPHRLLVSEIAEAYAKEFAYYRRSLAEREILIPRNLDFDRFNRQQTTFPHYQVERIDAMLAAHAIDSSAIIVGVDHTGAHIYKVRDPGVADSYAIPNFACIGIGKDIAEAQFRVAKYDKMWSLPRALWLAFSAKARAEVAGGVGPQTDLIVIGPGRIEYTTDDHTRELYEHFKRMREKELSAQEEVVSALEAQLRTAQEKAAQGGGQDASPDAGGHASHTSKGSAAEPQKPKDDPITSA